MSTVVVICKETTDEYKSYKSEHVHESNDDDIYYDWNIIDKHLYIRRWASHGLDKTICAYAPRAWLKVEKHD